MGTKEEDIARFLQVTSTAGTQHEASVRRQLEALKHHEVINKLNDAFTPGHLKLHERYWDKKISKDILRVPTGWLYSDWDAVNDIPINTLFVPRKNNL